MAHDSSTPKRRFRIAFSFSGDKRDFVSRVATLLAARFGEDAILYDKYHEAEFSHAELAFTLPELYRDETDLVVAILCKNYEISEWCGLEWKAIFDLINKGKAKEVMLARFDHATAKGLHSHAGYMELDDRTPEEATNLILQRLAINEGEPKNSYLERPASPETPALIQSRDRSIDVLTQALTGHPREYISGALPKVAEATRIALENQHPQTDIKVELIDGVPTFTVTPKEGADPDQFIIVPPNREEAIRLQKLLSEGKPFELPDDFQIKTSGAIHPEILSPELKFKYSFDPDNKLEAELLLSTPDQSTAPVHIPGTCRVGMSLISFRGNIGQDLLIVEIEFPIEDGHPLDKSKFHTTRGTFEAWEGKPVRYLPHFPKVRDFYRIFRGPIEATISIQGHKLFRATCETKNSVSTTDLLEDMQFFSDLAEQLGIEPIFTTQGLKKIDPKLVSILKDVYKTGKFIEELQEDEILTLGVSILPNSHFPEPGDTPFSLKAVHPPCKAPFFNYQLSIPEISIIFPGRVVSLEKEGGSAEAKLELKRGSAILYQMHGTLTAGQSEEPPSAHVT